MTRVGALIRGGLLGAAATYFFDPDVGRRRRALVRDQLVHWLTTAKQELRGEVRDLSNRAQGAVASMRRVGRSPALNDESIAGRVRSRLRSLEHPRGIGVDVRDGRVHLTGPVLARDAERARRIVRRVRGALELVDELEVHERPDLPVLRERQRGEPDPVARLAIGLVTMAAARPVARWAGPTRTAGTVALCALGAAVANVERARMRALDHRAGTRASP